MRIAIIGASGTVGMAVSRQLSARHHVIRLSRQTDPAIDLSKPMELATSFQRVGQIDALVSCAAGVPMVPLAGREPAEVLATISAKLLGQIELVRLAASCLSDQGAIVLTAGRFQQACPGMSLGAMVNSGLGSFVAAAATEMPRGIRLNAVSPGWISETLVAMGQDDEAGTPASVVAAAYTALLEGRHQGQVLSP